MTVIGLTGGIASGKSTAAGWLKELGAVIIDADRLGHRVYEPGTPGFEAVVNEFGHDIVAPDGSINRQLLGGKVFGDPAQMDRLTAIVWPEIRRLANQEVADLKRQSKTQHIVLEAAVLIEAKWFDLVEEVWVVTVEPEVARDRLMARNSLSADQAQSRIDAQISNKERLTYAYVKIDNSGTLDDFRAKVEGEWKKLLARNKQSEPAPAKAAPARTASRATAAPVAAKAPARPAAAKATAAPKATPSRATSAAAKPKTVASSAKTTAPAKVAARPTAKPPAAATRTSAARATAASKATTPAKAPARGTTAARTSTASKPAASGARPASTRPSAARTASTRPAAAAGRATSTRAASRPSAAARPAAARTTTSKTPARTAARTTAAARTPARTAASGRRTSR